jgi:hypothetical protein
MAKFSRHATSGKTGPRWSGWAIGGKLWQSAAHGNVIAADDLFLSID